MAYILWGECPGCCGAEVQCPCAPECWYCSATSSSYTISASCAAECGGACDPCPSDCWHCACNEGISNAVSSVCDTLCGLACAGSCIPCNRCVGYICSTDPSIASNNLATCNIECALADPPGTCFPFEFDC